MCSTYMCLQKSSRAEVNADPSADGLLSAESATLYSLGILLTLASYTLLKYTMFKHKLGCSKNNKSAGSIFCL